ncbi:hypothetical protein N0V83_001898 [Neocucurbitaria cava]|uniref:Uncharacterized protein n=1 Tax=Neocucurbitaria cava TaxID=798079 RepID=A0A9W8YDM9_9PLEO|nr:hypothetical protein N0V83_001898 [Neocucurbitaria cava]
MQRLVEMRGGFRNLMKEAPHLAPTLVIYTLPSWDQIDITTYPEKTIEDVMDTYSFIFPYILCPPELFRELLRTNHLRQKASAPMMLCEIEPEHVLEAHDLLARIEAFVPEDWAQPGQYYDEWLLIGTMYQSALAIYCTMSMQSLTILPNTLEMNSMRSIHGDRLLTSLRASAKLPRVMKFIVWPLVVAGVEALYRDEATRNCIESILTDQSRIQGTSSPLKARAVLRRYWQKGVPGWDECFDRPYVFII